MCDSPESNAFTQNIINHIDPKIYTTLNADQINAFREAVFKCRPTRKHWINFRGFIPLIFTRIYFVFLMGRDQRSKRQKVEPDRRFSL